MHYFSDFRPISDFNSLFFVFFILTAFVFRSKCQPFRTVAFTLRIYVIDISSETHYVRAFDWRGLELAKTFKFESASCGFKHFMDLDQCQ